MEEATAPQACVSAMQVIALSSRFRQTFERFCDSCYPQRFKGKGSSLDIVSLTILDSGAYNFGSGSCLALAVVARRKLAATHSPR